MSTPQHPGRPRRARGAAGCLRPLLVLVLLGGVLYLLAGHDHDSDDNAAPAGAPPGISATSATSATAPDDATDTPAGDPTSGDGAIEAGDCLSVDGPQPTSTGTVDVSNITQVDCGSSAARYKVVGVEPFTTDMNSCATDFEQSTAALLDQGQYFSEVYCVVDAGS